MAAAALAALTTVAACSSASPSTSTSSSGSVFEGSAPRGVTLTLWHNTADPTALLNLYKAYEKWSGNTIDLVDIPSSDFPTVTATKWATGARPDILEWHGNQTNVAQLDLESDAFNLSSMAFVKKEGQLAKMAGSYDGQTYAASIGFPSIFGIFYNKADFEKAGLTPPKTYADLTNDCTILKAKDSGVSPIYEAGGDQWPTQVLSAFDYDAQYNDNDSLAASVMNGSSKLTDASGPFIKGLEAYDALKDCFNANAKTASWDDSLSAVLDGSAAMVANSTDSIPVLDADENGDAAKVDATVGFVAVSATESVANYSPTPLGTYYVPKTGDLEKERAAIQFIEYITGAGYGNYVGQSGEPPTLSGTAVPTMQGLWEEAYAAYKAGATLSIDSVIPGFTSYGSLAQGLLDGQDTPAEVASKQQAYFEEAQAAAGQ